MSISIALWAVALQPPSVFRQLEHILVTLRPYIVLFSLSSIYRRWNQVTPAVPRKLAVYLTPFETPATVAGNPHAAGARSIGSFRLSHFPQLHIIRESKVWCKQVTTVCACLDARVELSAGRVTGGRSERCHVY